MITIYSKSILSRQQVKSNETRQKLLKAVDKLMKQYTYDSITVRNICDISNVSIGSFYHHFQTKENLLSIYLAERYFEFSKEYFTKEKNLDEYDHIEKIIEIFKSIAVHCRIRGYEFVASFQSTKNKGLLPSPKEDYMNTAVFSLAFHQSVEILNQGKQEKILIEDVDTTKVSYDLCILCHGFLYNWCVSEGELDFEGLIDRVFRAYLNSLLNKPH
ncbi:TetR/AcrR family transcriptional regulator [Anaerosolibacter carboniphilus]